MSILSWRNLIHDKVRLGVTLTGIVFAVVLIVVEFGLFLGFMTTTSSLIDRSGADLWIIAERVPYIELGIPFSERKLSAVLATPGVAEAQKYVARFTQWQRPDGRQENVQVAGFNLDGTLGRPWNVVAGTIHDLEAVPGPHGISERRACTPSQGHVSARGGQTGGRAPRSSRARREAERLSGGSQRRAETARRDRSRAGR